MNFDVHSIVTPLLYIAAGIILILIIRSLMGVVTIREDQVGQVIKKISVNGRRLPDGQIIAKNGEAGYQADTLAPGLHFWYWPWMFKIIKDDQIKIPPGKLGLVSAKDGKPLSEARILGPKTACNMFQDSRAFLANGGTKGKQSSVLLAGIYRINRALFDVSLTDVTLIESDRVGIVTTTDGMPMPQGQMAGAIILNHDDFQNPDGFVANKGSRGLQEQVLLAGQYNLNPWFVHVDQVPLLEVPIGSVGVVVSFVGDEKQDVSGDKFTHGNIVPKGGRGVWAEPLYPGKHPINPRTMKVELVPTTNIVLNWANTRSESHKLDEGLCTITVRSQDGFTFNLDVSQIINIGAKEASYVISRVGSVKNLVNQVLEPIIGNYFRNSAQQYTVLDFLNARSDRQKEAFARITAAIKEYDVQSVDTLIGDITPPAELMKPLTDRKVAEQEKKTYEIQQQAQDTRKALVAAKALADKQTELVNEEQNIQIAERKAAAVLKQAAGEAGAIQQRGQAEANIIAIKGLKEAEAIEAVGLAKAKASKAGVEAMGENYALVQIFTALADKGIKLVPEVNVTGQADGSNSALLGVVLSRLGNGHTNGLTIPDDGIKAK